MNAHKWIEMSGEILPPESLGHRCAGKLKLATDNEHVLDKDIVFVEDGHKYYVRGEVMPLSVTGLIDSVASDHFDPDAIIEKMKCGRNWPNPQYADMDVTTGEMVPWTDASIKQHWAVNGKAAADLGTDLHSKIELYFNDIRFPHIAGQANYVEFNYFLQWWNTKKTHFTPFRTEWIIYDTDAKVAGSVDFVMKNTVTGKYYIVDWKRCKTHDAGFTKSFGKKLLPPLAHLDQTKSQKWAVQVNVYREILEKNYDIEVEGMCMVVFHTENEQAQVHEFPRLDVRDLLWGA